MATNYDATNDILTVGDGTKTNPITFEDLYNIDQANGWGVVKKQGDRQYEITSHFQIINGYLRDKNAQILLSKQDLDFKIYYNHSGIHLGELDPYGNPVNGCTLDAPNIKYLRPYNINRIGDVYFYDSKINLPTDLTLYQESNAFLKLLGNEITAKSMTVKKHFEIRGNYFPKQMDKFIYPASAGSGVHDSISDNHIVSASTGIVHYARDNNSATEIYRNIRIDHTQIADILLYTRPENTPLYLVDCIFPHADDSLVISRQYNYETDVYVQHSFDPVFYDAQGNLLVGYDVELKDADGDIVFQDSTNVEGKLNNGAKDVTNYRYHFVQNGLQIENKNPHTLHITKTGELDVTMKLVIDRKMGEVPIVVDPVNNVHSFDDVYDAVLQVPEEVWKEDSTQDFGDDSMGELVKETNIHAKLADQNTFVNQQQ